MRLSQFFEGTGNLLSMPRLLMFLSFWPASWVLVKEPTETALGLYLGAYVTGYLGGKISDKMGGSNALDSDGTQQGQVRMEHAITTLESSSTSGPISGECMDRPLPNSPSMGSRPARTNKRKPRRAF